MSQSNFVFGALFVAFIVYITAKGELPTYLQLMTGTGAGDAGAANTKSATPPPAGGLGGAGTGYPLLDSIEKGLEFFFGSKPPSFP